MTKEYNFSGELIHPSGQKMVDETGKPIMLYQQLLGLLLGRTPGIDAAKAMLIAMAVAKEPHVITLDKIDSDKLVNFINNAEITNILKYHLLECLK